MQNNDYEYIPSIICPRCRKKTGNSQVNNMDDVEITEVQFQRFMTLIAKEFREKVKNVEKLLLA